MKNQKYYTIRTILKSSRKIVETGKIDTPNTYIHDRSLSWIWTGNQIKGGGINLSQKKHRKHELCFLFPFFSNLIFFSDSAGSAYNIYFYNPTCMQVNI
jgi:hypothetical protein